MRNYMTADEIYDAAMELVAPLPCQEQYIRGLSAIFSYHVKKNMLMDAGFDAQELPQQSAVIVAPSGQGKTHILQAVSKICKTNIITIDGSMLCREGWKGINISQAILAAKKSVKNDEEFARSIVLVDECDKLRQWNTVHDESNAQVNLLQLYDGRSLVAEGEGREPVTIDLNRFTVILAGAFSGLEDIIRQRVMPQAEIGFSRADKVEYTTAQLMKMAKLDDLVDYGMMRELMGRVGSLLYIDPMQYEDYRQLLTAENGHIYKYNTFLNSFHGVGMTITEDAVKTIADECIDSPTGARAILPLINDLMREAMTMVDRDERINKVVLDSKDGQCMITYEYGLREEPIVVNKSVPKEPMEPYVLEGSVHEVVSKLCEIYMEAQGNVTVLPELRTFLQTSLLFLSTEVNDEDLNFRSLVKLAHITKDDMSDYKTTYEIMLERAIRQGTATPLLEECLESYRNKQTPNTMRKLTVALDCIISYIYENYHSNDVKFKFTDSDRI